MKILQFENLGKAYVGINQEAITGGLKASFLGNHNIIENVIVEVKYNELGGLELGKFGYKPGKIRSLKTNYFDEERWISFVEEVESLKTKEITFYTFKQKSKMNGKDRRNCLLNLGYSAIQKTVFINWRTTELGARFGADLIFLKELIDDLEEVNDVDRIVLHLHQGYQEMVTFPAFYETYKMKGLKKASDRYKEAFKYNKDKYYYPELSEDTLYTKWSPVMAAQRGLIEYRKRR